MSLTAYRQGKSIKPFKKAPLPFMGQKRNFLNYFKEVLTCRFVWRFWFTISYCKKFLS